MTEAILNSPLVAARPDRDGHERRAITPVLDAFFDGLDGGAEQLLSAYLERATAQLIALVNAEARRFTAKPRYDEIVKTINFALASGRPARPDDRLLRQRHLRPDPGPVPERLRYGDRSTPVQGEYVADALFGDPVDPRTLKVDVLAAVGDRQPSNGEYVKYCESSTLGVRGAPPCPKGGFLSDKMLGRPSLLPNLRAAPGNHDYLAGDAGSNSVTDNTCAPATTYNDAHGYFDSLGDVEKTGPKRASDAWLSSYMSSTGSGVPTDCNKGRDGSGGYYWYQVGQPADGSTPGWHWSVIVLNGNCTPATALFNPTATGCNPGSDQYRWLSAVLDHINGTEGGAAGTPQCVSVMMHQQGWTNTNSQHGGVVKSLYAPLWALMHEKGTDLVVNGNLHVYERFLPLGRANTQGKPVLEDATSPGGPGVIQITASTGGETHAKKTQNTDGVAGYDSPFYALNSPSRLLDAGTGRQVSAAQDNSAYGTVNVTLHADGFDSSFAAVNDGSGASYSDSIFRHLPEHPVMRGAEHPGRRPVEGAS